jgi:polysaccharide pyruvyl transferase WcaK-like protein
MFGLKLDYREFVKSVLEQLLTDKSARVLLVPHTFATDGRVESDPEACRDVRQRLSPSLRDRVHLLSRAYNQHEIKWIIGLCDFFIGSRMHACIAAMSQGVPTVGVAYSRKFEGVFDTVGAADWVIDGRTVSVEEALRRVEMMFAQRRLRASALREHVTAARDELASTFTEILCARPITGRDGGRADPSSRGADPEPTVLIATDTHL